MSELEEVGKWGTGSVVFLRSRDKVHVLGKPRREAISIIEIKMLRGLQHPNVLQYRGNVGGSPCYMFTEWNKSAMDLQEMLQHENPSQNRLLCCAVDVALGLQYIASKQLVHGTLSLKSCITWANQTKLVIDDLILARRTKTVIPVHDSAPEQLEAKPDKASDIYQLGLLLYKLMHSGQNPFVAVPAEQLRGMMRGFERPQLSKDPSLDSDLFVIISECLAFNPTERPLIGDVAKRLQDLRDGRDRWEFDGSLTLIRNLGSGEYGVVDQMTATGLRDYDGSVCVAVKTLRNATPQACEEFKKEM